MNFVGIWILNPLKPVAGSQWHWGLRCLASIFGIRLIIFVFGDFCVFKEIFCGNASHPVVAFVSVVAFCGLLWSFVTSRCFCMMVCGAKCHFYGHCRIFVVFVTIMAFMVIQLGCSAFRICFW